jgi:hypothetical protein
MTKPSPPVRIKLYGLFSITRRGYYVLLTTCGTLLGASVIWWALARQKDLSQDGVPARLTAWTWAWDNFPLLVLIGVLVALLEVVMVLRKFSREEAAQRAKQNPGGAA